MEVGMQEHLDWLYALRRFGMRLGLETMTMLCDLLDNPHQTYKSVHLAGTNGKGSTGAMLASILEEAGLTVGLYTSPHLERFNERIQINRKPITDNAIARHLAHIRPLISEKVEATFFEVTTALAFLHFAEQKVDMAVIETGMGGRLDATNVVVPELSIITSISKDHVQYLGDNEEAILKEKLGIVKHKVPVLGALPPHLTLIAQAVSANKEAPLHLLGKDFDVVPEASSEKGERFSYRGIHKYSDLFIPLLGQHMIRNAALAVRAAEHLLHNLRHEQIREGLRKVVWPARFQIIHHHPLCVLDASHNVAGFAETLPCLHRFSYKRLLCVLGFSQQRDVESILSLLKPYAPELVITEPLHQPLDSRTVEGVAEKNGFTLLGRIAHPEQAVEYAKQHLGSDDCLFITGSIYLAGALGGSLLPDRNHHRPK